jgi:hypothetical protein
MLAFALEAKAQNEQLRSFLILPPEDFQGDQAELLRLGILDPPPPQQQQLVPPAPPPRAVGALPVPAAPPVLGLFGAAAAVRMPEKPDLRYLVVKADSHHALFLKVSDLVYQMTRQQPRTETLEEIFHAAKTLDVMSPFYKLDDGRLRIVQSLDGRGNPPTSRIKAFLVRQAPSAGGGGGEGKKKNKYASAASLHSYCCP